MPAYKVDSEKVASEMDLAGGAGFLDLLKYLGPLALGAGALLKIGRDQAFVRKDIDRHDIEIKRHDGKFTALETSLNLITRDHGDLRAAVAALPTRQEMREEFESLRDDYRREFRGSAK